MVGVPTSIAGQTICALLIESHRVTRRWTPALVERLQLIADILGAALQRRRHESALRSSLAEIERLNARLEADNVYLKEEIKSYHDFDDIVGQSAPLRVALARLAQVAPTNSSVLLLGPTGTGKELFARAVHERSRRHARALVRVNCAALPPTLVESELFGHEKGAFTGAVGDASGSLRTGRWRDDLPRRDRRSADGHPGEVPARAAGGGIRAGRIVTVKEGGRPGHRGDAPQPRSRGRRGTFRADLYYRLSVYPIHLPSLRERVDDIPRLVWFFIHRHQRDLGRQITKVPQSLMDALQRYAVAGQRAGARERGGARDDRVRLGTRCSSTRRCARSARRRPGLP